MVFGSGEVGGAARSSVCLRLALSAQDRDEAGINEANDRKEGMKNDEKACW
jgi:hypothetical protein